MSVLPPVVLVNGIPADPSQVVMPITVSHGRSKPDKQPDAPDCTLIWKDITTAPVLGDEVAVVALLGADGGETLTRFVGLVTDSDVQEYKGMPGHVRIVAVSKQADLGRVGVVLDRPAESDVARVQAIAAAAAVTLTVHGNAGPALAPDTIDKDALGALHEVCASSGGLVWSDGDGSLHYGTADHRSLLDPIAAIGSNVIITGLRWQSTVSELINKVVVKWGPEGGQSQRTLRDNKSIVDFGIREKSVSTMLNSEDDAVQLGNLILGRRAWPFSRVDDIIMDSDHVQSDEAAMEAAIRLKVSDAVYLPIPPDPGPAGLSAAWCVEGWQEEWPRHDRVILQIAVSDRARFALTVLRVWADAQPNTWQEELDRGSWLECLIKRPGEGEGSPR